MPRGTLRQDFYRDVISLQVEKVMLVFFSWLCGVHQLNLGKSHITFLKFKMMSQFSNILKSFARFFRQICVMSSSLPGLVVVESLSTAEIGVNQTLLLILPNRRYHNYCVAPMKSYCYGTCNNAIMPSLHNVHKCCYWPQSWVQLALWPMWGMALVNIFESITPGYDLKLC